MAEGRGVIAFHICEPRAHQSLEAPRLPSIQREFIIMCREYSKAWYLYLICQVCKVQGQKIIGSLRQSIGLVLIDYSFSCSYANLNLTMPSHATHLNCH